MADTNKHKANDDSVSISDVVKWQDSLKKDIDFNKPDNEMTPEEVAQKAVYLAMDKAIEDAVGPDVKKDLDEKRNQMEALSEFQTYLNKLVELGKEVEKHFVWQSAYLINHFDKGPDNRFKTVVDAMTTDVVNPDKQVSNIQRVELAKKILEIIGEYRNKVANELHAKHEIISALLPSLEQAFKQIDFGVFGEVTGHKEGADLMKAQFAQWLSLSKELLKYRKKAIEAVDEDLAIEELLPKQIIQNDGDVSKPLSSMEAVGLKTKGERMVRLIREADTAEGEIGDERNQLSMQLFGKLETYMDMDFVKAADSDHSTLANGKSKFRKLFDGDLGLATTYWVYGVGGGILFRILDAVFADMDDDFLYALLGLLSIGYFAVVAVGIFRAAEKYKGPKVWKVLAQLVVVIGAVSVIAAFLGL